MCCQNERCVRNELIYFSPYEPLLGEVAPEDRATVLRGIVMRCALEEEPPVAGIPAIERRGCPPAGEVPSETACAATGTVLIARTVGERRGPPRLKPPDPNPSLASAAVIARIIHDRARPAILACYRAALAECPGLAGVLKVGFTVAEDGAAQDVEPFGPGLFPELDACVLDEIRSLAFPPKELSHLKITWPFTFIPIKDLSAE